MLVRKWMTPHPITVETESPVSEAIHLMKEHNIRHLPVMDGGRLVGIVSDRDLKEYMPSKATTLDVYELHYALSRAKVGDAMRKDPLRVGPDDTIEKAALLLHDNKIGCLPVVEGDRLVGILAHEDVFEALIQVTGARTDTVRFQLTIPDEPGSIRQVADRVRAHGLKIRSILTTYQDVPEGKRELILRVEGDTLALEAELKAEYPDLLVHRGV
ncbi:CBS and ACT domain-containing protein [Deferrisoma palaeochoriense]